MATPEAIAGTLALFVLAAVAFVGVNLAIGRLVRPRLPSPEKQEVYECGEPVVGSSFVQFDLRFYVIALLFIVFDVEVAFFFPWAIAFGKSSQLAAAAQSAAEASDTALAARWAAAAASRAEELGVAPPASDQQSLIEAANAATLLAQSCALEMGVFFAVLLVGFAYVWSRGDLDWVYTTVNRPVAMPSHAATRAA